MPNTQTLGELVRATREARGWKQEKLAAKSRISRTTISYIECDQLTWVRGATLKKIARALGLDVAELFRLSLVGGRK